MQKIFTLSLLVILFFPISTYAQFQGNVYQTFQDASVDMNGTNIHSPWCGGINSVQINHADLNNDGKKDIVLYDNHNYFIKTFINIGNASEIKYSYAPSYEKNFPNINNFLSLQDYNCDGIPDLFHRGSYGIAVYKGYYQSNELKFTFYRDLFFQGANGPVNAYVQPSDIPSIIDIDKDGDLDFLGFDVLGTKLVYYKNMRVEDGLPCDSIRIIDADNCWGKFFQNIYRTVVMGITCKGVSVENKKSRHSGNCILHVDIDGDNDYDLLDGNISFSDVQLLFNNGADIINDQDTTYNHNAHILKLPNWPAPFHVDIDNDGDKDLLFSAHSDDLSSANYNAVAWYKNLGTDAAPNFAFQHDSLFTPDMIDVGSYSYPTFFDYDKDGKKDLFIGNEGYLDNQTGLLKSKIAYFKNTSTIGNSSFTLITKDFLNLSIHNYAGIFPTFGDVTGDGIDDLVMGNTKGSLAVYKNTALSNSASPLFNWYTDSLPNVFVNKYSMPVVYDFNQDGKQDLLIGNQLGTLSYYEDTSNNALKKLALKTISIGNIKAGSTNQFHGYGAPFIGKMDNTNIEYLMMGNIDGTVERYDSFANNYGNFIRIDSNYSSIQTSARSVPAIADIDGDGNFEMVVGNKMGGLTYYKQVLNVVSTSDIFISPLSVELFPNPSNDFAHILFKVDIGNQNAIISFYDVLGRKMKEYTFVTQKNNTFDLSSLVAGMYFVQIQIGKNKILKKIIKGDKKL